MPNKNHFDYVIIGNGLAGLQLALGFCKNDKLKNKKIALIDPLDKSTNDKTWSFWEIGSSSWDIITEKSWDLAQFHSKKKSVALSLKPYQYKSIQSITFYNWAKTQLNLCFCPIVKRN